MYSLNLCKVCYTFPINKDNLLWMFNFVFILICIKLEYESEKKNSSNLNHKKDLFIIGITGMLQRPL